MCHPSNPKLNVRLSSVRRSVYCKRSIISGNKKCSVTANKFLPRFRDRTTHYITYITTHYITEGCTVCQTPEGVHSLHHFWHFCVCVWHLHTCRSPLCNSVCVTCLTFLAIHTCFLISAGWTIFLFPVYLFHLDTRCCRVHM